MKALRDDRHNKYQVQRKDASVVEAPLASNGTSLSTSFFYQLLTLFGRHLLSLRHLAAFRRCACSSSFTSLSEDLSPPIYSTVRERTKVLIKRRATETALLPLSEKARRVVYFFPLLNQFRHANSRRLWEIMKIYIQSDSYKMINAITSRD